MNGFTITDLQPGDQMFGPIGGAAGGLVGVGQLLVAPWKHDLTWRRWWKIRHTAVVTQAADSRYRPGGGKVGGPMIGQAEPGGFQEIQIGAEHWTSDYVWIRPRWTFSEQGSYVASLAQTMAAYKVPYAFEDYAAIAAHRAHLPVPHLDRFISKTDSLTGLPSRAICSQANDALLTRSGGLTADGKVFDDGRLAQDVIPSELYLRLLELNPELIICPGKVELSTSARHLEPGGAVGLASHYGLL